MFRKPILRIFPVLLTIGSLATAQIAYAADATPGNGSTSIYVSGVAAGTTTAVVQYYNQAGTACSPLSVSLNGYGSDAFDGTDLTAAGCSGSFNGSAIISSDNDVAAVGIMQWTGGSAASPNGDGLRAEAYTGSYVASDKLYYPGIVYQVSGSGTSCSTATRIQDAQFTVQNVTSQQVQIGLTYNARSGATSAGPLLDTIPAYGQKTYDVSQPSSVVPDLTTVADWTNCAWSGAVVITSSVASSLAGAATEVQEFTNLLYDALSDSSADSTLLYPAVERRVIQDTTNFTQANFAGFTVLGVQNIGTTSTVVTITFTSRNTAAPAGVRWFTDTIPAGVAKAYSTRSGADTPLTGCARYSIDCSGGTNYFYRDISYWDDVPTGSGNADGPNNISQGYSLWVGSAKIEGQPGSKLVGTTTGQSFYGQPHTRENNGATFTAFTPSAAKNWCVIPYVSREVNTNGTGVEWSNPIVQVPGDTAATNIDFFFYNANGTEQAAGTYINQSAPANGQLAVVLKSSTFSALGTSWRGSLRITSDVPIVCGVENRWSTDTSLATNVPNRFASYNGK